MKRRALFALVAATAVVLGGCSADNGESRGGATTATPTVTQHSDPNLREGADIEAQQFVEELLKANDMSFRSESVTEGAAPSSSVMLYEKVDGVEHIHMTLKADDMEMEVITIGDDVWVSDGDEWVKNSGVPVVRGGDTLQRYTDDIIAVEYVGSSGDGHQFSVDLELLEGIDEMTTDIWVDNTYKLTKRVTTSVVGGEESTTTETRSQHGSEFGIEAPTP